MSTFYAYTSPASGHLFPMVPGFLALQDRGHTVHLRTAPKHVDAVRAAGLRDVEGVDPRILEIPATDYEVSNPRERLTRGLEDLMKRGPYEMAQFRDDVAALQPDVLLTDMNAYGAVVAAEATGLPWASIQPTLLAYPTDEVPPFGFGLKPIAGPVGRMRNRLMNRLMVSVYSKAMMPGINRLRADAGLAPLPDAIEHVVRPDRLIVLTGEPLEYPRTGLPDMFRHVGPQIWEPEEDAPDWLLEDGDPWVLVTCSTEYQGDETLARAAIEPCATSRSASS